MATLDTVIVGAGQAGLGVSYFLQQAGRKHAVFEQGRIGESWLSQRWDSFTLNTPNFMNSLPGFSYEGPEPDGFFLREMTWSVIFSDTLSAFNCRFNPVFR